MLKQSIRSMALVMVSLLGALALGGCMGTMPDVDPVRVTDLPENFEPTLPLLFEFRPGDQIPIEVGVDGNLVTSVAGGQSPMLTVQRRFFVLVTEDGSMRLSLDGEQLIHPHGELHIGLAVTELLGPHMQVKLHAKVDD